MKVRMQGMNWKTMVMAVTKVRMLGLMLWIKTPSHLQQSWNQLHQKKRKKDQAAIKQKSVALKKVNQVEIMQAQRYERYVKSFK